MIRLRKYLTPIIITACYVAAVQGRPSAAYALGTSFLYTLSDFTGPILYGGASVFSDKQRNEVYVLSEGLIRVFDTNGMEIYRFNGDSNLNSVASLAFDPDGTIYALSYQSMKYSSAYRILRCNYRGEPIGSIEIKGFPPEVKEFTPSYLAYWNGQFYLADAMNMRVVITDMNGQVRKSFDLISLLELKDKDRGDVELGGFSVDKDGNMLFTVPVLFSASVLSPDGKISSFGQPGSIPGKFANISDIVRDNKGNILVADKLKSVVDVFDGNFNFLMEFGGRGNSPGSIVVPWSMAVDNLDRIYVTQASNRGVSVFRLLYN